MRIRSGIWNLAPRLAVCAWALALAVVGVAGQVRVATVADAASRFEIQVSAGYDSYARQDDWTPVRVSIKNNGGDFRGVLRIDDASASTNTSGFGGGFKGSMCCGGATAPVGFAARQLDVVVPANSTRHYTIYVAGDQTPRANLLEGGNKVASGEVAQPLNNTSATAMLVAVVSDQVDTLDHLSLVHLGAGTTLHIVHLKPAEIPASGVLLRSFDSLAFDDASTDALTGDQRTAIRDYVTAGGGLLLVGGPNAQKTLAGIPTDLQPVKVAGTARDDLRGVGGVTGTAAPAGGAEVSTGRTVPGARAVSDGAIPVLAWLRVGAGSVVYTAFDAGAEPVTSWTGERTLLRQLVNRATSARPADVKGNSRPVAGSRPSLDYSSISSVLTNLPSLDVPSVGLIAWLLLAYAMVIGPGNYFLLKSMRHRHLAWLTIPAVVAVASSAVLLVGFNIKGVGTQVNQVRVIQMTASSPRQYVVTYSGVIVAHRGDYSLSLPDGAFFGTAPSNGYPPPDTRVAIDGDPPRALLQGMTAYSVRTIAAEGYVNAHGQVAIDSHVNGANIVGAVTNNTGRDIEDAFVVYGGSFQQLGTLHPGSSQPMSVNIASAFRGSDIASSIFPNTQVFNGSSTTAAERGRQRRAQVVRGLTSNGFAAVTSGPMLIGFQPRTGREPQIDGRAVQVQGDDVIVVALPMAVDPQATTVTVGEITPRVVDFDGLAESFAGGFGSSTTRINSGSATVEFDLPGGGWNSVSIGTGTSGLSIGSATIPCVQAIPGTVTVVPGGGSFAPQAPVPPGASSSSGSVVTVPAPIPVPAGNCVSGPVALAIYNFKTAKWDAANPSISGRTTIDPASQVSPEGAVLLRLTAAPGASAMVSGTDIAASRKAPL